MRQGARRVGAFVGLAVLVWPYLAMSDDVVISEFQAVNVSTLVDEDGDSSDWLELYNAGSAAVQLSGWHLSNDVAEPMQWTFPAVELEARQYLVVFASGKDRRDATSPLHTNFKLAGGGEFLALLDPSLAIVSSFGTSYPNQRVDASYGQPMDVVEAVLSTPSNAARYLIPAPDDSFDASWRELDFDDSEWVEGVAAIGFDRKGTPNLLDLIETDVGDAMRRVSSTLYLRIPFDVGVDDVAKQLRLRLAYDDGFVAFLNGAEVASRNLFSTSEGLGADSRAAVTRRGDEGRSFEEIRLLGKSHFLRAGRNLLAIHGLNARANNNDFFLASELTVVEGRLSGEEAAGYFEHPTPGWPNSPDFDGIAEPPAITPEDGLHVGSVEVILTATDAEATIRYTLDGTDPKPDSLLYSAPLELVESTEVRARSFHPTRIGSVVVEQSYTIVSEELAKFSSDLPIVVVASRVADDWSDGRILVFDGTPENRASLDSPAVVRERVGLKVRGSSSARRPKRSFSLELRDAEGNDLDRAILGLPDESDYILYGAYNFDRALLRNPFIYEVSRQVGRYATRSRFCELFVSPLSSQVTPTNYQGVYSLMEKIKRGPDRVPVDGLRPEHDAEPEISGGYMFKRDRLDPDDEGLAVGGERFAWVDPKESEVTAAQSNWLTDYIGSLQSALAGDSFADPESGYAQYLDVGSFVDHHLLNELAKNPDEFVLSTYMFKPRGGKIHAGPIWDFDRAMGSNDDSRSSNPEGWLGPDRAWYGRLFDDPAFVARYTSRWEQLRAGALATENLLAIVDSMADRVREAQERNFARWTLHLGEGGWQVGQVDRLKTWLAERVAWMDSALLTTPPVFEPSRGAVPRGTRVIVTAPEGTVYYTLGVSDPRATGGGVAESALLYTDGIEITEDVLVVARARLHPTLWTEKTVGRFTVVPDELRVPGDFDQDGRLSLGDAIGWIRFLLGQESSPCNSSTATRALFDLNHDGAGNLTDAVHLLTFLFRDGPVPAAGVQCVRFAGCAQACNET